MVHKPCRLLQIDSFLQVAASAHDFLASANTEVAAAIGDDLRTIRSDRQPIAGRNHTRASVHVREPFQVGRL